MGYKPRIRFKGFTEDWEQRKLGNLTQLITKGTTPKVKNIQNGINFIKVENISDDGVISINSYVSEEEHMNYLSRSILANNDILFSIAGTLGRTAIVKSHLLPANTNQALAIIRLNKSVDVEYINTFLKSNAIKTYIRKNPTVGAQPNLSLGQVSDLEINIPNYSEQKKISNLFSKFDLMITLHQCKLEKLKLTKKALLQKLFPKNGKHIPEIRFKGFTDAWEQRKLGEIADITKLAGFEFTKYIVYSDKGNIIALRGLNIKDGDLNLEDVKYIDSSDFTKLKRSKLFRNDILFTYVGTIGEVARIQDADKYYLAPNVSRIRIKNRLLSEFLMYCMDRDLFYQKIIFPLIATSSQPALSMANIREFNITYPSDTNEQQKIALVFNRISHLITLHQRKLERLQEVKKGLLQKMFV